MHIYWYWWCGTQTLLSHQSPLVSLPNSTFNYMNCSQGFKYLRSIPPLPPSVSPLGDGDLVQAAASVWNPFCLHLLLSSAYIYASQLMPQASSLSGSIPNYYPNHPSCFGSLSYGSSQLTVCTHLDTPHTLFSYVYLLIYFPDQTQNSLKSGIPYFRVPNSCVNN